MNQWNEAALVERLERAFPQYHQPLGIGDDAAILGSHVLTTDMLIEDVDFTASIPIEFTAAKALAVNLSDLAAMGARPLAFLLSIGLPPWAVERFDRFVDGLSDCAAEYGIALIGGDLSAAGKLTISITAIGAAPARPLLRTGARPGDRIYVSRPLGGSATGLQLLQRGWNIDAAQTVGAPASFEFHVREVAASAILRHVAPAPEVALGAELASIPEVTSCIDISDGLSSDLHRLCAASRCGALIDSDRLPPFPDLPQVARLFGIRVEDVVLHGGEEFALLFTSSLREAELSERCGRPVFSIGRIRAGSGVSIERNGVEEELEARGYDHFAGRQEPPVAG